MCEATGLQNVQNKYHDDLPVCYFHAHNAVQMRLNFNAALGEAGVSMQAQVASVLSCASTSRRCSKGNWRTRFSAAAMCDSKARAGHGLKRLLCCCGWCGAMDSHLPGPWGGFSLRKRLLMAAFTRGEEETVREIGVSVLVLHQQEALRLLCFP